MAARQLRLEFFIGDEPALVEIDQQHLARLQPPLHENVLLGNRQYTHLGGHDDAIVARDEIPRRAQPIAVERRSDLASIGEGDRRRAIPRLHQRRIIFIESAALLAHQRITGPRFRNHHHHGVRERIASHHQKFERVVETSGVRLAFV